MQSELVTSLYTSVHDPGSHPDCLLVCLLSILCSVSDICPFPLLCGFFLLLCSFLGTQDGTLGTFSNISASVEGSTPVPSPVTGYLQDRLGAYCTGLSSEAPRLALLVGSEASVRPAPYTPLSVHGCLWSQPMSRRKLLTPFQVEN